MPLTLAHSATTRTRITEIGWLQRFLATRMNWPPLGSRQSERRGHIGFQAK